MTVDDAPDITLTVKVGLEASGLFEVDTFNDPELALSSFRPGLYDLALLDMKMPKIYGHELYDEMKKIDDRLKVCFMTATYQNYEALRAAFPTIERENQSSNDKSSFLIKGRTIIKLHVSCEDCRIIF